jgi:hypothetical protein
MAKKAKKIVEEPLKTVKTSMRLNISMWLWG